MTTTTAPTNSPADVLDAMRSIQSEADRWRLADALSAQIPEGSDGFDEIVDAATAAGVAGNLSAHTLRLYRDTSNRWPAAKRNETVSFSAHREVMVLDTIEQRTKMLADLSKNLGSGKVTVAAVRKAVAVAKGRVPAGASANGSKAKAIDGLLDLSTGAKELIGAITAATDADELDRLQAGLTKALAHVERLRAKAARKATTATKAAARRPAPKATPAKATTSPAKKAPARKAAAPKRDLRGL